MDVTSWLEMDPDDRSGYLQDYIYCYAKENGVSVPEDVWQLDLNSREFMLNCLAAAGVFDD